MPNTNYGKASVTVPLETDYNPGGPDVPRALEEYHDSLEADYLTAAEGRLLIAQPGDIARFKAMNGDVTIDKDGATRLQNSGHFVNLGELTRTNTAFGSFGTPIKITLPKVYKGQLLEVMVAGFTKASIETTSPSVGGSLGLKFGGVVERSSPLNNEEGSLAANTWAAVLSAVSYPPGASTQRLLYEATTQTNAETRSPYEGWVGVGQLGRTAAWLPFGAIEADATNYEVELVGKCSGGGTISARNIALWARVTC